MDANERRGGRGRGQNREDTHHIDASAKNRDGNSPQIKSPTQPPSHDNQRNAGRAARRQRGPRRLPQDYVPVGSSVRNYPLKLSLFRNQAIPILIEV